MSFNVGSLVDWILALLAMEGAALLWMHYRGHLQARPLDLLAMLAAGAGLLLALRAALHAQGGAIMAGWLALAGLAHGVDLSRRLRQHRAAQRSF